MKLSELFRTRSKKSGPEMFNFFVVLTGHDMFTGAGKVTRRRRKFKAPLLQTKSTKNEGLSENMGFDGKPV